MRPSTGRVCSSWPTGARTPTARSSSSPWPKHPTSTARCDPSPFSFSPAQTQTCAGADGCSSVGARAALRLWTSCLRVRTRPGDRSPPYGRRRPTRPARPDRPFRPTRAGSQGARSHTGRGRRSRSIAEPKQEQEQGEGRQPVALAFPRTKEGKELEDASVGLALRVGFVQVALAFAPSPAIKEVAVE